VVHPEILKLYKQIPSSICKPGCSECCGPVPFAKSEWESLADKRTATTMDCPYISETNTCEIYEQRPFLCRLYNACDDPLLKCPKGCGPEKPLSWEKARKLTNRYHELIGK
jgi:uncharacterized protein